MSTTDALAATRADIEQLVTDATAHLDPRPQVFPEVPEVFTGPIVVVTESQPWLAETEDELYGAVVSRWELVPVADLADPATMRAWLDAATSALLAALGPADVADVTAHLTATHRDRPYRCVRVTATATTHL